MNTQKIHPDLKHSVLGFTYAADGITVARLCTIWPRYSADHLEAALQALVSEGYVACDGERFTATENGRSRYLIDDNCKGW